MQLYGETKIPVKAFPPHNPVWRVASAKETKGTVKAAKALEQRGPAIA
jgi:hypothetical protein